MRKLTCYLFVILFCFLTSCQKQKTKSGTKDLVHSVENVSCEGTENNSYAIVEDSISSLNVLKAIESQLSDEYGFSLVASEEVELTKKEVFIYEFMLHRLLEGENLIVEYELQGVKNGDALYRRFNDKTSVGGAVAIIGNQWFKQQEELPSNLFHEGR